MNNRSRILGNDYCPEHKKTQEDIAMILRYPLSEYCAECVIDHLKSRESLYNKIWIEHLDCPEFSAIIHARSDHRMHGSKSDQD